MESISAYLDRVHMGKILAAKAEREQPFVFMLKDRLGHAWIIEARFRTKGELDRYVADFAEEFRDDNDGYAPVAGEDFLATETYDYDLPDGGETLTAKDYREIYAEQAREEAQLLG
jgi:hypothetical protein